MGNREWGMGSGEWEVGKNGRGILAYSPLPTPYYPLPALFLLAPKQIRTPAHQPVQK